MVEPRSVHWVAAKHVLHYLSGTVDFGLDYRRSEGIILVGYIDSDWEVVWHTGRALSYVASVWAQ